jgi:predicted PurR-regulated permease PerM
LLLLIGCVVVLRPFVSALLWAAVLCFTTWPVYCRLLRSFRNRRTLAALAMSVAMILIIVLPFFAIGATLAQNVTELVRDIRQWFDVGLGAPPHWVAKVPVIGPTLGDYWRTLTDDDAKRLAFAKQMAQPIGSGLLTVGGILVGGLTELTLSIFITFFLFRDGAAAAESLMVGMERLGGPRARHLLLVAGDTVRSVVYGILGTAIAQGVLAGIGFLIAGVPGAALLALLTFFASVLMVGPPLVWIPVTIWLFCAGRPGWATFVLIWGIGVSALEHVLKPWLISRGNRMPFLLIFLGGLGGILAFGFIGVFLGPTLLAVGYRVVVEWIAPQPTGKPVPDRQDACPDGPG